MKCLEALYNNLALRLSNNNRPAYDPPSGLALKDILTKFDELESAENSRSIALHNELARQLKLDKMAKRFHVDAEKIENWSKEKETYLVNKEDIDSVPKAQLHLKLLDAFTKEHANVKSNRFAALKSLAAEITGDNYQFSSKITAKNSELETKFNKLLELSEQKKQSTRSRFGQRTT